MGPGGGGEEGEKERSIVYRRRQVDGDDEVLQEGFCVTVVCFPVVGLVFGSLPLDIFGL